jgi:hypothetical protein
MNIQSPVNLLKRGFFAASSAKRRTQEFTRKGMEATGKGMRGSGEALHLVSFIALTALAESNSRLNFLVVPAIKMINDLGRGIAKAGNELQACSKRD